MTLQEKIDIMTAHLNGLPVQMTERHSNNPWDDIHHPSWNWRDTAYRIKPTAFEPGETTLRDGTKACIYRTEAGGAFPIHGAYWIEEEDTWELECWPEGGKHTHEDNLGDIMPNA